MRILTSDRTRFVLELASVTIALLFFTAIDAESSSSQEREKQSRQSREARKVHAGKAAAPELFSAILRRPVLPAGTVVA